MLFAYTIIYKKTKIIYNVHKRTGPKRTFSEKEPFPIRKMGPKRTGPNVPKRTFQKKRGEKNENTKNNLKIKDR